MKSNRVEISNPGGLPSGLPMTMFGRKSVTRNPIIADLLHHIGYIEKIGTGIQRIKDIMATTNNSVDFEINEQWFTTIFSRNNINVTENQSRLSQILTLMQDNPKITISELAKQLNISKRTILRDIEKLKQDKLTRTGTNRDGEWITIKKEADL